MTPPLRARLLNGAPCLGTFVQMEASNGLEIIGTAGFDFAIVDLEHGGLDVPDAVDLVRSADAVGLPLIARVPLGRLSATSALLDSGYRGLLVPQIHVADEVRQVVRSARYAPLGERGACAGIRADRFGAMTWAEHMADAEQSTVIAVTIETRDALANIDEIVTVEGIDVIFIGVFDLAASLGHPGEPTHPEVLESVSKICAAVKGSGVALGAWAPSIADAQAWMAMGMTFLPVLTDALLWAQACRSLLLEWEQVKAARPTSGAAAVSP